MSSPFGREYADVYDRMYTNKDYAQECDLIVSVVDRSLRGVRILDMGCGTGGHALTLARRGFDVAGIDVSAEMVRVAAAKAEAESLPIQWHVGDIVDADIGATFDVVTMMFAVLGYLTETDRLLAALRSARRHLEAGGKLVFDVWYGPAVLMERPGERAKVIPQEDGSVIRAVNPTLQADRDVVDVHTRLWRIADDRVVFDFTEVHAVRYFFIPELEHLLEDASFTVDGFFDFPDVNVAPTPQSWNLGCIASAV